MIEQRINKSLNIERLLKDIMSNKLFASLHEGGVFQEWKNNETFVYKTFKLNTFEPFDKFDFFNDKCHLKIHQKLKRDEHSHYTLTNKINLEEETLFPNIYITYKISIDPNSIKFKISYSTDYENDITRPIYDAILRIGFENMIQYHIDHITHRYS